MKYPVPEFSDIYRGSEGKTASPGLKYPVPEDSDIYRGSKKKTASPGLKYPVPEDSGLRERKENCFTWVEVSGPGGFRSTGSKGKLLHLG